jgi:adenine-specific DNA methylase
MGWFLGRTETAQFRAERAKAALDELVIALARQQARQDHEVEAVKAALSENERRVRRLSPQG